MEYDTAVLYLVAQSRLSLCDPNGLHPTPGSSIHGNSPGKNTEVGCHVLLPGDLPNPGIEPRSPTLQMDSLPSEPPGKTKNTGVGSLSLLHGIFPTQESNRGLLHCRRIFLPAELSGKPNGIWCNQSKWLNFIANFLSMPIKFAIIQQNHKDRKEQSLFYIKFRWYSRNKMPNGNCDRSMAELLRDTLQVESLYRPVTLFIILKCDQVGEGWVTLTRGRQGRWVWLPPQWSS